MKYLLFIMLLSVSMVSCENKPKKETIRADLAEIIASYKDSINMTQAMAGGLETSANTRVVQTHRARIVQQHNGIRLTCEDDSCSIQLLPQVVSLPVDWQHFSSFYIKMTNRSTQSLEIQLSITSRRGKLFQQFNINKGEQLKIEQSLRELPLISRGKSNKPLIQIEIVVKHFDTIHHPIVEIVDMGLVKDPDASKIVTDVFGQRVGKKWPGKVLDSMDLIHAAQNERLGYTELNIPMDRDRFGGWKNGPQYEATGFFRLERGKTNQGITHWWLVDPLGFPFWSLGVTGVRYKYPNSKSELTIISEREQLFTRLPDNEGVYASLYEDSMFSFYGWNVLRKWGSIEEWRKTVDDRVANWGLNTLGNWSDEELLKQTNIPYTRFLASNGTGAIRIGSTRLVDVFDPSWTEYLDSSFSHIQQYRDDSLLIGFFVDNEQNWGNLSLLTHAGKSSALRSYWNQWVREKYGSVVIVNNNWNTDFQHWDEIDTWDFPIDKRNEQLKGDIISLETAYAEKYFALISKTLRQYDPNHLYLGCRFTKRLKPEYIVKIAGKYCDVITINNYSLYPQQDRMEQWHKLSGGLPILIGEHHLPLRTERQLAPPYQNFSHEERTKYYIQYEEKWSKMPFSIGSHWYQWVDQPLTGRASDGENQPVGFVDIVDQPYEDLIQASRHISSNMYVWHLEGSTMNEQ